MSEWKPETQERTGNLIQQMIQECNAYGSGPSAAAGMMDALRKSHPTLQQSFWRVIKDVAEQYAEYEYIDLRNKAARDWCKSATEAGQDVYLPTV